MKKRVRKIMRWTAGSSCVVYSVFAWYLSECYGQRVGDVGFWDVLVPFAIAAFSAFLLYKLQEAER